MITLKDYLDGKAALGFGSYGTGLKPEKEYKKNKDKKSLPLRLRKDIKEK